MALNPISAVRAMAPRHVNRHWAVRPAIGVAFVTAVLLAGGRASGADGDFGSGINFLAMPPVGAHRLTILAPRMLELNLVTTEPPGGRPSAWDFAGADGRAHLPTSGRFRVLVAGRPDGVTATGFKRRVLYAPLRKQDLRIASELYLELDRPVPEDAVVEVLNPDALLWPTAIRWTAHADRLRWSPIIHVNQVGYATNFPKKALVGYYLGSLGELTISSQSRFALVEAASGRQVFEAALTLRPDRGYEYPIEPYQNVLQADFSSFQTPGEYRLLVPGLGASFPFFIHDGVAAAFARAYALGIYHQRCSAANELPFTRFVHAPCHTAQAEVPTMAFQHVNQVLAQESANYKDNPRHTAPQLKDVNSSLYRFVRTGKIDVSGGHHDAGDYSKYTINSAQFIHALVFAVDAFPSVGELDNLGIPESGDGKSDLLQMAKWEADFLVKMQDADGGFYFLVYPRDRSYEGDVLPDSGDSQVVFPKTTAATAAATAALAEAASSHTLKREFPDAAARYLAAAKRGWKFVERARAKYGADGSYQKITHYGDTFMHDDEIAWAATELYLATGDPAIHDFLLKSFDPSDPKTLHWGWERMFESYGAAIREYAFADRTGRMPVSKLDAALLTKCRQQILACAQDQLDWASDCAYGTSFPRESKRFRTAGWYFAMSHAFDLAVADALEPNPKYLDAILTNLNFEAGANPNNVTFITGLGWRRQREIVDQFAENDRRVMPPSGIPLGSVQEGFSYLEPYKRELGQLSFPPDGDKDDPYPFYDRWGDSFNLSTEFTIPIQARGLAALAALMVRTPLKIQQWRCEPAQIVGMPAQVRPGSLITVRLDVGGLNLQDARILWESSGREPQFGPTLTFVPTGPGPAWIEAEAQLPDGRRVFGVVDFQVAP